MSQLRLAVLDLETDPFEYKVVPEPFVAGFYDGEQYIQIWDPFCTDKMVVAINKCANGPYCIYAHNGGKFDWFYFLPHLKGEMRIINGRIAQAHMGEHEIRDSYSILPIPLRAYDKDEIDYNKLHKSRRENHREEIGKYLKKDCTSLYTLVTQFRAEFGDNLTIGGAALKQLKARHKFQTTGERFDAKFRKDYYFGGRVEVFKAGIVKMPMKIYDVNSMYPYVMKSALHPVGSIPIVDKKIRKNTCFVVAEGRNYGAFCGRDEAGGLTFQRETGTFCTTIHEWRAAEDTKTFRTSRIIKTYGFDNRISFDEFVSHFYSERQSAKLNGDKIHDIFYKLILNSSYGKFAQNPENFQDYAITSFDDEALPAPWTAAHIHGKYIIWCKPTDRKHWNNVCTGASITGAARAILLRGIHAAIDPLYCDTDSIICRSMRPNVQLDNSTLGAWKLEGQGTIAAFAGKKLYSILNTAETCTCGEGSKRACGYHVKKAHKGARLTHSQIFKIANGAVIECLSEVPAFRLNGSHQFVKRNIRRTI